MAAAFDYVICLAASPAQDTITLEFMHGMWIEPALVAAYTQRQHRLAQSTAVASLVNSPLRVRLDTAPIFQYDWTNGLDVPYIVADNAMDYIRNGGVYGDMTLADIHKLEIWLGGKRKLSQHVYDSVIIKSKDDINDEKYRILWKRRRTECAVCAAAGTTVCCYFMKIVVIIIVMIRPTANTH